MERGEKFQVILTSISYLTSLALAVSPLWPLDKPAWIHLPPGDPDHWALEISASPSVPPA